MVHKNARTVNDCFGSSMTPGLRSRRLQSPGGRGWAAPSPTTVVQSRTFQSVTRPPVTYGSSFANCLDHGLCEGAEKNSTAPSTGSAKAPPSSSSPRAMRCAGVFHVRAAELRRGVRGRPGRRYRRGGSAWRFRRIEEAAHHRPRRPSVRVQFSSLASWSPIALLAWRNAADSRCATATSSSTPRVPRRAPPSSAPPIRRYSHMGVIFIATASRTCTKPSRPCATRRSRAGPRAATAAGTSSSG